MCLFPFHLHSRLMTAKTGRAQNILGATKYKTSKRNDQEIPQSQTAYKPVAS